jgi:Peptidase M50B-like
MVRTDLKRRDLLARAVLMLLVYVMLAYFGGATRQLMYPVIWLVAFLHELGHALAALLTGGRVLDLTVNADGSGLTTTQGGITAFILMGGYIGSAIFGNVLFYLGAVRRRLTRPALSILAFLMIFSALMWSVNLISSVLLILFAIALILIATRTRFGPDTCLFLGMATVVYIIFDFRVGPSSDLAQYNERIGVFPTEIWMFIWLGIVVWITWSNLQRIF